MGAGAVQAVAFDEGQSENADASAAATGQARDFQPSELRSLRIIGFRSQEDLLLGVLTFLKKLSVFEENKA